MRTGRGDNAENGSRWAFDPGWCFVLAGCVMLAATLIIPAADDLHAARNTRDRAIALEQHRSERLSRHSSYYDALRRADEALVIELSARSLNRVPASLDVVRGPGDQTMYDADVFAELEPALVVPAQEQPADTLLRRLVTDPTARLWVMAGALLSIFWGLLPAATRPVKQGGDEHIQNEQGAGDALDSDDDSALDESEDDSDWDDEVAWEDEDQGGIEDEDEEEDSWEWDEEEGVEDDDDWDEADEEWEEDEDDAR